MRVFRVMLSLCCAAIGSISALQANSLTHLGTFEWPAEAVVGLSGLEISEDGMTYHVVSDQGWYISGQFTREGDSITDISVTQFLPLLGHDGLPVAARRVGDWSDAEGLAIAADGTHWVSFERWAHVSRFAGAGQRGEWIKDHPSFNDYSQNKQLEGLALHPDGTLYVFPEDALSEGIPIYKLVSNKWEISGYIAPLDGFSIVGADFDVQGQLYLLERKLHLGLWWQSRVRRLDVATPQDAEILWTSVPGTYHNLEGIAVWADANGARLTMVSDNNNNPDEVTQFVEFRVTAL